MNLAVWTASDYRAVKTLSAEFKLTSQVEAWPVGLNSSPRADGIL